MADEDEDIPSEDDGSFVDDYEVDADEIRGIIEQINRAKQQQQEQQQGITTATMTHSNNGIMVPSVFISPSSAKSISTPPEVPTPSPSPSSSPHFSPKENGNDGGDPVVDDDAVAADTSSNIEPDLRTSKSQPPRLPERQETIDSYEDDQ
jgi:hypothetical protein